MTTPQNELWGHCLFFGKAGTDSLGRFVATPNSWNERTKDTLHPDGWQKLRQEWFDNSGRFLFNAWTLIDKITKNMTFQKEVGKSSIYLVNETAKKKTMIIDMNTLSILGNQFTEV